MSNSQIVPVHLQDVVKLVNISIATFKETFGGSNTDDDMSQYIDERLSKQQLSLELSNPNSQFYFAYLGGELAGYLKVNFASAQTESKLDNAMEIERIYALTEFHGKNVGRQLMQKALQLALHHAVDYIWLGVWEKNERAIQFYIKNGFEVFDQHIFVLGDDRQIDIMMKKAITNSFE
jgi:ribosomal protein S18 acetylase RimI-like enzyme